MFWHWIHMAFGGTESSRFTLFLIEGEIGSEKVSAIMIYIKCNSKINTQKCN